MAAIELNIDQLVLDGFPVRDRDRIGAAVEMELSRLLAERGVPSTLTGGQTVAEVTAESITIRPNASAEEIGRQIALAVYEGLA